MKKFSILTYPLEQCCIGGRSLPRIITLAICVSACAWKHICSSRFFIVRITDHSAITRAAELCPGSVLPPGALSSLRKMMAALWGRSSEVLAQGACWVWEECCSWLLMFFPSSSLPFPLVYSSFVWLSVLILSPDPATSWRPCLALTSMHCIPISVHSFNTQSVGRQWFAWQPFPLIVTNIVLCRLGCTLK